MSSPAVTSSPPFATGPTDQLSVSVLNSLRVAAIVERLSLYFVFDDPAGTRHPNGVAYYSLLLSLARGIDYAVANNDIPDKIEQIPELLKEEVQNKNSLACLTVLCSVADILICHRKSDASSLALVMVLMISVKNACNMGWFPEKEKQELFSLFDDIGSFFYNPRDIYCGTGDSLLAISTIFARFYPQLRMGETITSLEVKPGYGTFLRDFHISKDTAHSPEEKIRLLVARTDNTETSACIISPPQVNFLLNGKAVVRRTNIFMDAGPQMPTNVTSMLKYGTNLLQAVGQFDGHYVIALAFMSVTLPVDSSGLKDYIPPTAVTAPDSDPDLVVGPSRVSLNCPISHSRIQVPVKGQSCKHSQCFDFSNFVNINSRLPTWRCPHCNQCVSYTDLRIDQSIAKILRDVGNDITDVMISDDGSWKAITESNLDNANSKISDSLAEAPEMQGSTNPPSMSNILDLTVDDVEMDAVMNIEDEDRKPSSDLKNTCAAYPDPAQPEENFWSRDFVMPTTSNAGSDPQVIIDGAFDPTVLSNLTSPVITDSISPMLGNQGVHCLGSTSSVDPIVQSPFSASNSLQLQQPQLVNSIPTNEYGYGSRQSIPMNVTRTSITAQGLPASPQTPNLSQRANYNMNSMIRNSSSTASPATLSEHQHQLPRRLPTSPPPSFWQTTTMQDHPHSPAQLFQRALNRSVIPAQQQHLVQLQGTPRTSSTGLFTGFQNPHLQIALNKNRPPPTSHSPITTSPRYHLNHAETPLLQIPTTSGLPRFISHTSSQQANPSYRQHIPPEIGISPPPGFRLPSTSEEQQRRNGVAGVQPSLSSEGSGDMASEQNWRPTGRMRGSLAGRPLTGEISRLVIQPTQPARPSGPLAPSNPISATLSAPPHLRASISNDRNTSTGNAQNN